MLFPFPTKWNYDEYEEILLTAKGWLYGKHRILDIGCGRGESTHFLNATGLEIKHFDSWKHFDNEFIIYNGVIFPFKDNKFDGFFLNNVFEHIANKQFFIQELKRLTKKKSIFVFILPTAIWKAKCLLHFPKYYAGWLRGYGWGNRDWFVHAPEIYGVNYFCEFSDYMNWQRILEKDFNILEKRHAKHGEQIIFKAELSYAKDKDDG